MQTCFFAISGVLPREEAIAAIKKSIQKTYGKRGDAVIRKNFAAVDAALNHLREVAVPDRVTSRLPMRPPVSPEAPAFVREVLAPIIAGEGDLLPVSKMPQDGTFATGTARWEKRNIALEIPVWDERLCIQCGKCVLVCPHAVIRSKVFREDALAGAPSAFKAVPARWPASYNGFGDRRYTLQVAPEDCTGCALCVAVCPVKDKTDTKRKALNMAPQPPLRDRERANWDFFLRLSEADRSELNHAQVKDVQLLEPLFEFSGACAGCGETPYVKLITQLFGDRMVIANATGCSSIYGGNLPTTPYSANNDGRGPAWSNSLFEDNTEFGLGMRLSIDKQNEHAREVLVRLKEQLGNELVDAILGATQQKEADIAAQRERVAELERRLAALGSAEAKQLSAIAGSLMKKASGLSEGMAGLTTSVTAVSITCFLPAAM